MQHEQALAVSTNFCPLCGKEMKAYVSHIHEIDSYLTPYEKGQVVSASAAITQNGVRPAISDQFCWEVEIRGTQHDRRERVLIVRTTPLEALEYTISRFRRKYVQQKFIRYGETA